MKSKAAIFLESTREHDIKDYMPKAMQWWSKLAPKQQKEYLAKLAKTAPDKVVQVYQDLYGTSPTAGATASEDMSKTKKVLMAAVLAAFMSASAAHAAAPTQADYDRYDRTHGKQTTTQTQQPSKQQQDYSKQYGGADAYDTEKSSTKVSISDVTDSGVAKVGKAAVDTYGTYGTRARVNKVASDVQFVKDALRVLTGN